MSEAPLRPLPSALSRRAVAKQETREALIAAGLAEFAERGLDAPSLDGICARAGFTRGAFYVHFRDREEFVGAAMERALRDFLDLILAPAPENVTIADAIDRFVMLVGSVRHRSERPFPVPFHRFLEAAARSRPLRARFVNLVQRTGLRLTAAARKDQDTGHLRSDLQPERVAELLVALALGTVTALDSKIGLDVAASREALYAVLAPRRPSRAGVVPPPGRRPRVSGRR